MTILRWGVRAKIKRMNIAVSIVDELKGEAITELSEIEERNKYR